MVNINASDVVDGKPSIVLGLIWTIILYFQVGEYFQSYIFKYCSQTDSEPFTFFFVFIYICVTFAVCIEVLDISFTESDLHHC